MGAKAAARARRGRKNAPAWASPGRVSGAGESMSAAVCWNRGAEAQPRAAGVGAAAGVYRLAQPEKSKRSHTQALSSALQLQFTPDSQVQFTPT